MHITQNYIEEKILIRGKAGQLELLITMQREQTHKTWGVICHPHSLFGGTMNNKVVTTLAKTFQGMGANTVRFNFRGVMKSEGKFDRGYGERDDLLAVVSWLYRIYAPTHLWLAGFSFGAYIAAFGATQLPADLLVTVAPPVVNFPMQDLPPITCHWILAQGLADEVVSAEAVLAFADTRHPKPIILSFKNMGHFFHGSLSVLRAAIEKAIQSTMR